MYQPAYDAPSDISSSDSSDVHPRWGPGMLHQRDTVNVSFYDVLTFNHSESWTESWIIICKAPI